jgi:CheY-like chemotaxis protein/HPt (histidine-containing phosphotransfer) domain-containing protein
MPGMDGLALAMEIHKLPGAAMMPLVLLMPLGLHSDAPGSTHIVFAHTVNKPVKPAQLCEALVRALLSPKAAVRQQPTSKPGQPLTGRLPLSILLCDDNAINQKVAARILQSIDYQPDLAANGREALDALDKKPYDLIFMDVMMPEMDGLEATRAIRERQKDGVAHPNYQSRIIIVAMTAQAMQGDREKCLAAGMDDYLSKPILPKDVRAIVERWASQATPAAPAAPAPKTDVPVSAPKADVPVPASAPKADAPVPVPVPKADVPVPASAPKADVPVPAPKADVPVPVPVPKADVPVPVPAPKADAPVPVPVPKADVPVPVPAPKADAPVPASAPKADVPVPVPAPKADAPAPVPEPEADAPAPAVEEPPVEMDILNDLTDGNADSLRELVDLFFKQTTQQLEQLEAAVHANKADDVRRVAHSCAGASATLGMTRFVPMLRKLERQGASGTLITATQVYEDTAREFKLIQNFLAAQLNSAAPLEATVHL